MEKYAFKMKLNPGMKAEYKRRHDEIWPSLVALLKQAGICDYSIHLDQETNILYDELMLRVDNLSRADQMPGAATQPGAKPAEGIKPIAPGGH